MPAALCFLLHVALFGENAVGYGFDGHPSKRETTRCFLRIDAVLVNSSRQSKVGHFEKLVVQNENISTGQVAMNETIGSQIFLRIKTQVATRKR